MIRAGTPDARTVDGLRARFRGVLVRPGTEGYDEARRVWNGRKPRGFAEFARDHAEAFGA